jgi:hypothetical protein
MTLRRLWCFALFGLVACESDPPASAPSKPDPVVKEEPKEKGPPLAKNDPRFKPYVPKPKKPLDFSKVDVGDAPMDGASESLDALGKAIVAALNAKDAEALEKVALTERDYKDRFFPITIHHKSGLGLGAELAWAELHGESIGDMRTALERYGGQSLEFVRFEAKEVDERPKVNLHRRPKVVVKNAKGEEQTLVMLGSIIEHTPTGGCKVLAFRDTP